MIFFYYACKPKIKKKISRGGGVEWGGGGQVGGVGSSKSIFLFTMDPILK